MKFQNFKYSQTRKVLQKRIRSTILIGICNNSLEIIELLIVFDNLFLHIDLFDSDFAMRISVKSTYTFKQSLKILNQNHKSSV